MFRDEAAAQRLRDARTRARLTEDALATATGLSIAWYRDLEQDPNELFSNVSLAHLQVIGHTVGLDPLTILTGAARLGPRRSFQELSMLLKTHRLAQGLSVEEFSESVGWELGDALVDPDEFWNFTVDGLADACAAVSLDWRDVLPDMGG